jgi:hypothetical protein
MAKLGDLYTDFFRIDLDARGGYARVADVVSHQEQGNSVHRAFKILRDGIDFQRGLEKFKDEQCLLTSINQDINAPLPITRIYDSGFVDSKLSHDLHERNEPDPEVVIHSTGAKPDDFLKMEKSLNAVETGKWLPYLAVELAPYDDSLLRQIHHQPKEDPSGLYRLPAGEVVAMAIQLLGIMEYLHTSHERAYMDWKPEHIFWSGRSNQVKLVDWNVTVPLADGPGREQNIRDDTRLFCGAALYISLTFVDPDNPMKPIGPRPTEEPQNAVPEIRRRYWTDNPNFYQRGATLDDRIKTIIRRGLDANKGYESPLELREELLNYAKQELGVAEGDLLPGSTPESPYFKALANMHVARDQFLQVQESLLSLIGTKGANPEFTWMFKTIKQALSNFPGS